MVVGNAHAESKSTSEDIVLQLNEKLLIESIGHHVRNFGVDERTISIPNNGIQFQANTTSKVLDEQEEGNLKLKGKIIITYQFQRSSSVKNEFYYEDDHLLIDYDATSKGENRDYFKVTYFAFENVAIDVGYEKIQSQVTLYNPTGSILGAILNAFQVKNTVETEFKLYKIGATYSYPLYQNSELRVDGFISGQWGVIKATSTYKKVGDVHNGTAGVLYTKEAGMSFLHRSGLFFKVGFGHDTNRIAPEKLVDPNKSGLTRRSKYGFIGAGFAF